MPFNYSLRKIGLTFMAVGFLYTQGCIATAIGLSYHLSQEDKPETTNKTCIEDKCSPEHQQNTLEFSVKEEQQQPQK